MRLLSCRPLAVSAVSLLALFGLSATQSTAGAATSPTPVHHSAGASLAAKSAAKAAVIPPSPPLPSGTKRACGTPTRIGVDACQLLLHAATAGTSGNRPAQPVTGAYTPSQLLGAYNLGTASAAAPAGTTVAIVDAYADPKLPGDLVTYRNQYSLPACNSSTGAGCLTVLNENGGTSLSGIPTDPTGGWEAEQALDVEMVSAICPSCKIVMLEANSDFTTDLGTAENAAVSVVGAKFVSNSWNGFDFDGESYLDATYFDHPGVATAFASGDSGYGAGYPASSQLVTSVGGTYLTMSGNTRESETVWNNEPSGLIGGTGSGCSAGEAKPAWQTDPGCANRTENDVSAVASGPEGISMYDSFDTCAGAGSNWCTGFGTSVATPIITSVYALAGTPTPGTYPSSYLYQSGHAANLNPITNGSNGTCESTRLYLCNAADSLSDGYNGPAGWGTPNGVAAFENSATGNTVSLYNPGTYDLQAGLDYSLPSMTAKDSSTTATVTYSATGLPSGLSINPANGAISGTLSSTPATSTVNVTAADGTGASSTVSFNIVTAASLDTAYHPGTGPVHLDLAGKCMDDSGNSTKNGNKIQIWSCNGGTAQKWTFYPDTDPGDAGQLTIHGKCLDIVNRGTANGSKVQLWSCTGGANQQWYIVGDAGELYNPISGKCLDDTGRSTTNGTQIQIWSCNDGTNQAWTLPASPVLSGITGKCMDDTAGSSANGNKIQIYSCNGEATQRWTIGLDGSLRINGKCLDATGNGTLDGTRIQLWSCLGHPNQEWVVGAFGTLENVNAEKCLDSASSANGTQLVLEDCYGEQGEVWAES